MTENSQHFLGIDHIGIAVNDLEAALHSYCDVLGFVNKGQETLPDRGLVTAFVQGGETTIELLAATRGDSQISGFLAKRGEGIHHICMAVDNLKQALSTMEAQGARIIGKGIQTGAHGAQVAFIHPKSTHGVLLELSQKSSEVG